MADYPSAPKSFTTKIAGDTIQPGHINDAQDEIMALENALLSSGIAHDFFPSSNNTRDLGTTALRFRDVYIAQALQGPMSVNGRTTMNGAVVVAAQEVHSAPVSAPQITSNQNDYSPTGLATARILRLATDASRNITGLAAQENGFRLTIRNAGSFDIVLKHEDSGSVEANRFSCPGGADLTLRTCANVELWYEGTGSRWAVGGV